MNHITNGEILIYVILFAVIVICIYCVRLIRRNFLITELQDSLTFVPHRGQTVEQMNAENRAILARIAELNKQKF